MSEQSGSLKRVQSLLAASGKTDAGVGNSSVATGPSDAGVPVRLIVPVVISLIALFVAGSATEGFNEDELAHLHVSSWMIGRGALPYRCSRWSSISTNLV